MTSYRPVYCFLTYENTSYDNICMKNEDYCLKCIRRLVYPLPGLGTFIVTVIIQPQGAHLKPRYAKLSLIAMMF